jgi:hypothetical protein
VASKKTSGQEIVKKAPSSVAVLEKKVEAHTQTSQSSTPSSQVHTTKSSSSTSNVTKIIVKYDVGFGNHLTLRGHGAPELSWDKGITLKNVKSNEWVLEITTSFAQAEFKVLINDKVYESGPNHTLKCGSTIHYSPHF